MILRMKRVFFVGGISLFLLLGGSAHAYVPEIITQESLHDITQITDPELSQAFFGELAGFPHTYEIHAEKPFTLYTQIRVPDIESSKNTVSGIIIKNKKKGRVEEVARFLAKDAGWAVQEDDMIGEQYREGAMFEKELDAGTYRIEVHTPDNLEKYILRIGKNEDMNIGYFALLGRIIEVKRFYGYSAFWIIQSPYVYIPIIIIGVMCALWCLFRKREYLREWYTMRYHKES